MLRAHFLLEIRSKEAADREVQKSSIRTERAILIEYGVKY